MLRKIAIILGAAGLILIAPYAMAHEHEGYFDAAVRAAPVDYARVIGVEPLVREVRIAVPVRDCVQERSYHPTEGDLEREPGAYDPRRSTTASMIVGGVLGAAIGNSVGSGDGRPLATVAGGIIGSAIGHEVAESRAQEYGETRARYRDRPNFAVERCGVQYEDRVEEHADGFRVTYEYAGYRHVIRLPYDPGEWLPVAAEPRWHHHDEDEGHE